MGKCLLISGALCIGLALPAVSRAQQPAAGPPPASYGSPSVTLEQAKKAVEAAEAEAKKNGLHQAIAVVSNSGWLVHFSRMDDTAFASIDVAQHKARSAAIYRRSTKSFADRLAAGAAGLAILMLDGAIAVEGGLPLMSGGKVIGAIGCSGATAEQDGQTCKAGADTIQ